MILKRIADVLAGLCAAFVLYIGLNFLIDPHTAITGFGLPESSWPTSEATAIMNVKGGRDLAMAMVITVLLLVRQHKALGWTLLAMALAPVTDATIVLAHGGSLAAAVGIHLATAAVVVLAGILQLRVAARATS